MKKIITAIGNEKLNKKLKEEESFNIITEDIQYREGILEILEQTNDIDFIILSELIPGEIELKELIHKIKIINSNIQIIIFLENKDQELENYFYAKGINFIFYNNQVQFSEIIELIKNNEENSNKQLKKELDELKQLLLEKEKIENKKLNIFSKINNKEKANEQNKQEDNKIEIKNNFNKEKNLKSDITNFYQEKLKSINEQKEIICISGTSGVGKSIFSINLAKSFMKDRNKILIIDFDILNNSLHTILGIKKYPEKIKNRIKNNNLLKEMQIEDLIMKINSKIDLISGINLLFDSQYKISSIKIKNIFLKLKQKYEIIIIDTSSECFLDYTREIMKNSNLNIFITESNLSEIKKAKNLLNIYINQWKLPQKNFNILFNKYNENSIDISILKNIFSGFSILGTLSVSSKYNLLINKNNINLLEENLQKEYSKINKKLVSEKIINNLYPKGEKNGLLKVFNYFLKKN